MAPKQQQQQVLVELPEGVEGRMLDLCKTDDALEWLRHTTPDVVSSIVKALKGSKSDYSNMNWVLMLGALPTSLADDHSDKFSERSVKDVVGLFESVLSDLAETASWKRTGVLDVYHNQLVGIIVPWARVPLFVKHMMKKGFAALAKLMKAPNQNVFPCPNLCETVLMVINNANLVSRMTIDEAAPLKMVDMIECVIYQLEATGLVAQALRALTSPVRDSQTYGIKGYLDFLNCVIRDEDLIKKRCRPGTNVGKILKALLDGTDGYKPGGDNSRANPDLELVQTRLKILYDKTLLDNEELALLRMVCRMCNKQSESLKRCGRCKCAAYCSRYVFRCFLVTILLSPDQDLLLGKKLTPSFFSRT
jgi:hypothetical protein